MPKTFTAQLVQYLVDEYFEGDALRFAKHTRYTKHQVDSWISGRRKPQKATVRWLLSTAIAPEFRVIKEFAPFTAMTKKDISRQLRVILDGHQNNCGVYAFYDSMCNVIYVGKASTGFFAEMYQQLRGKLQIEFPVAIRAAPRERWQAVRYVSAYEVPKVEHLDYQRHVEALLLRVSKPVGNKVLGKLNQTSAPKEASA